MGRTSHAPAHSLARVTALVALIGVVAACSISTAGPSWTGDGLHIVDGYWILAEHPCAVASTDLCVEEVRAAEASLGLDPATVVGRATASLPVMAVQSNGQVTEWLRNTSGLEVFAVLDLVGGSRRVVGIACLGVPNPDGSRACRPQPFDDYRVGHTPTH